MRGPARPGYGNYRPRRGKLEADLPNGCFPSRAAATPALYRGVLVAPAKARCNGGMVRQAVAPPPHAGRRPDPPGKTMNARDRQAARTPPRRPLPRPWRATLSRRARGVLSCVLLGLVAAAPAMAGFDEGLKAYRSGDHATAQREWLPLALEGHGLAQFHLGQAYLFGRGVAADDQRALAWLRKAAAQGEAQAQYLLATMIENGRGTARQPEAAAALYRQAADQGLARAQVALAVLTLAGRGVPRDDAAAHELLRRAATQRDARSEQLLGLGHREGQAGVPQAVATVAAGR